MRPSWVWLKNLGDWQAEFQQHEQQQQLHEQQQQQQPGVFSHQELEAQILAGATAPAETVTGEPSSSLLFGDLPDNLQEHDLQQHDQQQHWQGQLQQELQQQQQPGQHLHIQAQGYQPETARTASSSYLPVQAAAAGTAGYGTSGLEGQGQYDQQQAESLPPYADCGPTFCLL